MLDEILTALDEAVITRVKMTVSSITGSSGHGTNSEVQNPDRGDFLGNAENTPLMSASSRLDLNTNQDGNDEIRNEENFRDGEFPALKSNYDWRAQFHHMVTGHKASHNSIPEYLIGRIQTQNDTLS